MNLARHWGLSAASVLVVSFAGYAAGGPETPDGDKSTAPTKKDAPVNDPAFHQELLSVAAQYKSFGRLDSDPLWAPTLCRAPAPKQPRLSESADPQTHGRKLYYLYARDLPAYLSLSTFDGSKTSVRNEMAPGQAIVKEAWVPKVTFEGPQLTPDVKHALFIMLKTATGTPNTDEGWIYGTVSADGKSVTSAGRVQSCMGCHVQAPHGRLFGVKAAHFALTPVRRR